LKPEGTPSAYNEAGPYRCVQRFLLRRRNSRCYLGDRYADRMAGSYCIWPVHALRRERPESRAGCGRRRWSSTDLPKVAKHCDID